MLNHFLLIVLGFCMYRVFGQDNSTQVLYVKLMVEENVIANVSETLLNKTYTSSNYNLYSLIQTTVCDTAVNTCDCAEGFEWSAAACSSEAKCCGEETCKNTDFSCISKNTVIITGSLTLESRQYHGCLDASTTDNFKDCNKNLTTKITSIYSRIYGFDSLTITMYRTGSVIVEFEMVVISPVDPLVLHKTSQDLTTQMDASLSLETTGVARLQVPQGPVDFGTNPVLSCSLDTNLVPIWELMNYWNETKDIHNGTESTIISAPSSSNMQLTSVSQLWKGRYTCSFEQNQNKLNIVHKASADMDVCVRPTISSSIIPGFPRCKSNSDLPSVIVNCEVDQTYEEYNVSWEKADIDAHIIEKKTLNVLGMTVFSAQTFVSCTSDNPTVTCKLSNRCNQKAQTEVKIIMIKVNDTYCPADGDWDDTKADKNAVIKCIGSVGNRTRHCKSDGTWNKETSFCVNLELRSVLSNAKICDIGQGKKETNAENVFTRLQSVTNNTKAINSVANLETSVDVINTMSYKLDHLHNETTINGFLGSASNLMDSSLKNSWTTASDPNNKNNLAAEYLSSVEKMIKKADIKRQKNNPNLEVFSCKENQTTQCSNRVFNNTVMMKSPGAISIKTAGFLQLEHYLPNQYSKFTPNSIVVSITRESINKTDDVKISIDFQLMHPRPRNTEMKCVFWNTTSQNWSEEGCNWIVSSDKGVCECNHLSAFAILMSTTPLEVDYLSEVTYVGLSVSIISLIVCLAIELIIWSDVVKTDTLHLRHCAHVNISICLLVADVCFLASSLSDKLSDVWCKTFVVLQHFCYLAMFFWMLCLSSTLLHKTVYLSLRGISKTTYLRFSIIVGYVCPLLIVAITFLANNGEEGRYYSKETRWLVYNGTLKGSIFTFILPVGIIVFVNVFFMCLVIMRLLQPSKAMQTMAAKERNSAKTVIRSVILLTPVFGLTWGFGFVVILVDLTDGPMAYAVSYIFTIMNAFQGLYIFLTTCAGDKMVRDGLRRYFQKRISAGVSTHSSSGSNVDQSCKQEDKVKK